MMRLKASRGPMSDEELGKRDDDRKPRRSPHGSPSRMFSSPLRYRKRRIIIVIALCLLGWTLIYKFRGPDIREVLDEGKWEPVKKPIKETVEPPKEQAKDAPTPQDIADEKAVEEPAFSYKGRIRFYKLAATLKSAVEEIGYGRLSKNVFFIASNLKSASNLIPVACEMSQWKRNNVHMVLAGRNEISIEDIQKINGVDTKECEVFWHDARPDYAEFSTDIRAESSVMSALGHIHTHLKAPVIIIDDSRLEDAFFVRGIYAQADAIGRPIIEIPRDGSEKFQWLTRLDTASLISWHRPSIDILVHAQPDSSGSLLRLFHSLADADYTGLKPPRLILDLPADIDPAVKDYVSRMSWPATASADALSDSRPILRHRIPSRKTLPEEAALRFLESFYPTSDDSHVLLLSPQAQLSPTYYHYLRYALLEYKYSLYGRDDNKDAMGLSLEVPSTYLNGSTSFEAPKLQDMRSTKYTNQGDANAVPFLWEAPNSNGALYFGEKWAELHSFLTHRVASYQRKESKTPAKAKLVSENLPAWMEYCLEFMRARGYSMIYPGVTFKSSLVTIHTELFQPPEEFDRPSKHSSSTTESDITPPDRSRLKELSEQPFLLASDTPPPSPSPPGPEPAVAPHSRPLHDILPFNAALPATEHLPYLDHAGLPYAGSSAARKAADAFAQAFRRDQGGCRADPPAGARRKRVPGSAQDLFCTGDEDEGDFEPDAASSRYGASEPEFPDAGAIGVAPAEEPAEEEAEEGGEEDDDDKDAAETGERRLAQPTDAAE